MSTQNPSRKPRRAPTTSGSYLKRRIVQLTKDTGPKARLWAYSFADLAKLFGVTEQTVKNWASCHYNKQTGKLVKDREFDPGNLQSIIFYWIKRNQITSI